MGFNPFKTLREASERVDRIVREEIDDPRQWEAEIDGQSSQPGQSGQDQQR